MKHFRIANPTRLIAGLLLSGLLFAIMAVPLGAQPVAETHPFYDVTREVTLSGTIASVLTRAPARTLPGPHVILTTASGEVDASLGRWGLRGKGAPVMSAGQPIEVTGVMKTIRNQEVFVARIVKLGGKAYEVRNQHGFPVSPQSRQRMSLKTGQKGETL